MNKRYKQMGWAVVLALLAGGALFMTVVAEKTPPYVVAIRDTGDSHPQHVAVDPLSGYAYVLDQMNKVWIFQGTEITASLSIGNSPDIGVDPGRYVYITSREGNPVRVLVGTEQVGLVDLGVPTGAVAVLTTTHRAYVAVPTHPGCVRMLEGTTSNFPTITVGITPTAVAANPTTGLVYVVNYGDDTVSVIEGASVTKTVPVGHFPSFVAVNPANGYVYVTNSGDDTVSVLQRTTLVTTVSVGVEPGGIAVNPVSGRVYVVNGGSYIEPGSLSVLSGTTVITEVQIGTQPRAVDVNPQTGYIYVVGGRGVTGTVSVLSNTLVVETFLPVGHSPRDIAVNPATDLAYASLYKASGGKNVGQVVILGRTEASTQILDPDSATKTALLCAGVNGIPVLIKIPPHPVTETVTLLCTAWEPDTEPKYLFAGQGFFLKIYRQGVHQPGFRFQSPLTVGVGYSSTLPAGISQENLELRTGAPGEAWTLDGITFLAHDLPGHVFTTTLEHLPVFSQDGYALVAPRGNLYLPLVMRNH